MVLLVSLDAIAQPGYTTINARYRWYSGRVDSTFHVPTYNGLPSGVRSGGWIGDGAVAIDTANNRFYIYSGGVWNRVANYGEIAHSYPLSVVSATNTVTLENDTSATAPFRFYGFNVAGRRGYYPAYTLTTTGSITPTSSLGVLNIPKDQRTGDYLNLAKTHTKQRPLLFGSNMVFAGNSWSTESFTLGTPWPTQISTYFGKTKVIAGVVGDDLSWWVKRNWSNANSAGVDSIYFNDIQWIPLLGAATTGNPFSGTYYSDGINPTGTLNYIYGGFRSFFANYYRKRTGFSVASLADANFRDAVAADSLGTSSATGSIGLGAFQFTKTAGETAIAIGTYIADGTRKNQGTVTVTVDGVTRYSRNLDSLNAANKANTLALKAGLTYEVILLRDLPSAAVTVVVTASGDSTAFDYVDYLYTPEQAVRPLYVNNFGYNADGSFATISDGFTDSANMKLQDAVNDFYGYPIFIQNTNNWYNSTIHDNASHLSAAGNDSIALAYKRNLIPVAAAPYYNAPASGGGSFTPPGNYGNIIMNRNGAGDVAASDSLGYTTTTGIVARAAAFDIGAAGAGARLYGNGGLGGFILREGAGDHTAIVGQSGRIQLSTTFNTRVDIQDAFTGFSNRVRQAQGADVASAAGAIALGTDGNSFEITGTSAITLISNSNWVNGSKVTLLFTSTATLTDGTANSGTDIGMELNGNTNFTGSAGATITLMLSEIGGTQRWREIGRSVN